MSTRGKHAHVSPRLPDIPPGELLYRTASGSTLTKPVAWIRQYMHGKYREENLRAEIVPLTTTAEPCLMAQANIVLFNLAQITKARRRASEMCMDHFEDTARVLRISGKRWKKIKGGH